MPVDPAEPVVTAACVFCCRRAMGEVITRHSLRPLIFEGDLEGDLGNSSGAFRAARMRSHILRSSFFDRHAPRRRGNQYAAASRSMTGVSGILGRPVKPGDDVRTSCL